MKKFIATAVAAGALAAGGAASAQDLGSVLLNILGIGTQTHGYGAPAVVAPQAQIYVDQYGRRFYYDQIGRQVYLQDGGSQIIGYDSWGRPIYGQARTYGYGNYGAYGNSWDRDGDGIANTRDRWPNDPRYW